MSPDANAGLVQLNRRYRPALMSFFLRRVMDHAEAEDLTQEVFAKLSASNLGVMENADAYIFQMAANMLRDRGRRRQVRTNYRSNADLWEPPQTDVLDPGRILAGRETLRDAAAALRELPPRTRAIFLLFRLENMRQADIAAQYGMSVSGVQKHLMKAMTHLMKRLGGPE